MHRFPLDQARITERRTLPRWGAIQQQHLRAAALQMQRHGNANHASAEYDHRS
jgi:hypothetical protein